ncbi:hypothetical protein UCYN_06100 [Candidatus Atelocyanobacterium thalassa isolate ALOHA]|uniref:Uncharacterized protein n=1 Tax=Atelocyanobacterium thalassa (isolate ALOHA) TaxID=1453429 RepID=D3EPC9_ATETH|nr:hypothetical protein UCYN_06100 [Candidatus Atelocyanobacterium thalassa isolate ALOHA]
MELKGDKAVGDDKNGFLRENRLKTL